MIVDKNKSEQFWMIKGLCVISVFFAHMPSYDINSFNYILYGYLGIIGVPLFLILSGYFETFSTRSILYKAKKLFIPLFIWGSITFVISRFIIGKSLIDKSAILDYLTWIFGFGTWYYYVPVFFCSILLMRYVDKRILILICLLSIGLSQYKIIPYNKVFTYYINPFNFLIYMIIGTYLKDYLRRDKYSILFFFLGLSMILFSILCGSFGEKKMPVYFNYSCIPFAVGVLFIFSYLLQRISIPILIKIGKYSFVIYLFHMQIAGFVNGLFEKISIVPQFEFIKIFIALGIVYIVLLLFKRLLIRRGVLIDSFGYR